SVYILNLTVHPTYEFTENAAIGNGDSYNWHGQNLSTQGTYYDSLSTVQGCDSVYILNLTVHPTYEFTENTAICNGDSYNWHGQNFSTQGTYYDSLSTVQGCDSVYMLNLTIHPTYEFTENAAICNGDSYNWHGQNLNSQGSYYDSLSTVQGCDSVYILNLIVNDLPMVSLNGLNTFYCVYHDAVVMTGTPAGGIFSGQGVSGNEFTPSTAGLGTWPIVYSYTNSNSCTGNDTVWVEVDACMGTSENESLYFKLFPNPNSGQFTIVINEDMYITVFSLLGIEVYKGFYVKGTHVLNMQYLPAGIYNLCYEGKNIFEIETIIIQRQ
ncbi:MAG: hypothetical protein PHT69_16985, partial [Bacteroidales bacterium]|nr:hypothetical protein [Bacteroidales bacterium]